MERTNAPEAQAPKGDGLLVHYIGRTYDAVADAFFALARREGASEAGGRIRE